MPNVYAQFGEVEELPVLGHTVCYRTPKGGTGSGAPMTQEMAAIAVANFKKAYGPNARYWIAPYYEWRALLRNLPQRDDETL